MTGGSAVSVALLEATRGGRRPVTVDAANLATLREALLGLGSTLTLTANLSALNQRLQWSSGGPGVSG